MVTTRNINAFLLEAESASEFREIHSRCDETEIET